MGLGLYGNAVNLPFWLPNFTPYRATNCFALFQLLRLEQILAMLAKFSGEVSGDERKEPTSQ